MFIVSRTASSVSPPTLSKKMSGGLASRISRVLCVLSAEGFGDQQTGFGEGGRGRTVERDVKASKALEELDLVV